MNVIAAPTSLDYRTVDELYAAMAAAVSVGPVPALIVEADATGDDLPIGGRTRLDIPNNHLQYAVTWFSFAVILLVIYLLYHRRPIDHGASDGPETT